MGISIINWWVNVLIGRYIELFKNKFITLYEYNRISIYTPRYCNDVLRNVKFWIKYLFNCNIILGYIGSGYNEYNKIENLVKVVRKGFPGKNREILLTYPLNNIRSIGIKISEGLNPQRIIYLCLKDERKIPLTPVQQPDSISDLEDQAANLAKFLDLKLENL